MAWKVYYFQTVRGDFPVKDFVEKQDHPIRGKIGGFIRLLINNGPHIGPPYCKKMQNNLYELRISGSIAVRIFYTMYNNEYYLLHAFIKKSQKTPPKEIETALDRMKKLI